MFVATRTSLLRNPFTKTLVFGLAFGCSTMNAFVGPSIANADRAVNTEEYEEWGLKPPTAASRPSATPAPVTTESDEDWGLDAPNTPASKPARPAASQSAANRPAVPQDLASDIEQSTVVVVAIQPDGEKFYIPGWVVDRERGIIMTLHSMVNEAESIFVAFPQLSRGDEEVQGCPAVVMDSSGEMNVAYLQARELPSTLPSLRGSQQTVTTQQPTIHPVLDTRPGGGSNKPAHQTSPIVGRWYLQDVVNGLQVYIGAVFNAQGQFSMQVTTVGRSGQQEKIIDSGTYTVQGDTLIINGGNGVEQLPFWFENGMLVVEISSINMTCSFQPAQ